MGFRLLLLTLGSLGTIVVNAKWQVSISIGRNGSDFIQMNFLIVEGLQIDDEFRVVLQRYLWRLKLSLPKGQDV